MIYVAIDNEYNYSEIHESQIEDHDKFITEHVWAGTYEDARDFLRGCDRHWGLPEKETKIVEVLRENGWK